MASSSVLEKKVYASQLVYMLFMKLPDHFAIEKLILESLVESKKISASELRSRGGKYYDIISRADEFDIIRESGEYISRIITMAHSQYENPVSGIVRKFMIDQCVILRKVCAMNDRLAEMDVKTGYDAARAKLLMSTISIAETLQCASAIAQYRHIKNENNRILRQVRSLELALIWYDFAYKSCLTGKITA